MALLLAWQRAAGEIVARTRVAPKQGAVASGSSP